MSTTFTAGAFGHALFPLTAGDTKHSTSGLAEVELKIALRCVAFCGSLSFHVLLRIR